MEPVENGVAAGAQANWDRRWDEAPEHWCTCDECESIIFTGDAYYLIHGYPTCEECLEGFRRIAGSPQEEGELPWHG